MDEIDIISEEDVDEQIEISKEKYDSAYSLDNDGDGRGRKILSIKSLQFESVRLETFYYYKYKNTKDINKMAKRGFYYSRRCDVVLCYFCNTEIWSATNYEEPPEHANGNANCAINKFPLNGNVPLLDSAGSDAGDTLSNINSMLQEFMTQKVAIPDPVSKIYYFNEPSIFNPKSLELSPQNADINIETYEGRLSSYECWFEYLTEKERPKPELYAKAGFSYSGLSDLVACSNCRGGLFNVHPDDDPVKDHLKYYGHCSFIRKYCSSKNIEFNFPYSDTTTKTLTDDGKELLMHHPMIKALIDDGYEKLVVKKWIEDFVNMYCCFPNDIEMCKTGVDLEKENLCTENLETEQSKRRRIN